MKRKQATPDPVLVTKTGAVVTLTLNRPAKLNALTSEMRTSLLAALRNVETDPEARIAIINAAGDRAFCSGADLEELGARTMHSELSPDAGLRRALPQFIEEMGKPVIAAVHGYVLGAGLELALACTIRIAAKGAAFGLPEISHGILPGSGGTQRLTRLVGAGWALDMILSGRCIDAELAEKIGLVTRVSEPEQLLPQAIELAERLAALDPFALRVAKAATLRSFRRDLDQDIEVERQLFALCLAQKASASDRQGTANGEGPRRR